MPPKDRLAFIFDLDGVMYRGVEPQPHAREVIQALRNQGHVVRFFTNNSANSRLSYSNKLGSMGIPTPQEEIMTSSYAAALYFIEHNAQGKVVFQIGEKGMTEEIQAAGMDVITDCRERLDDHVDYVIVGIDHNFNYCKLERAQNAIIRGAQFLATNTDPTFPIEGGALQPGGGSMVAAVKTASGAEPFVIGKPETYAYNKILEIIGMPAERSIMIGDRLDTDVLCGNRAGAETVLVLTGVTNREEAEKAEGDYKPTRIINTLAELMN